MKFSINISLSQGTISEGKFSFVKTNDNFKSFYVIDESFLLIPGSYIAIIDLSLSGVADLTVLQEK